MLSVHLKRLRALRWLALIVALCSLPGTAGAPMASALAAGAPVAKFSSSPPAPDVDHPVTFDASASSDPGGEAITSYQWSFGDGVTQTSSSPLTTHVYTTVGSFTAVLTVQDSGGATSTAVSQVVKVAADKPTARFSANPASTLIAKTVKFDATASSDSDGDAIVSYRWDFGDGGTQTTSGPITSHMYGVAGTYTATLTVIDSHDNPSGPRSAMIKVAAPSPVPRPPAALFTFSPAHPVTGQAVTFNASASSAAAGVTIRSYRWSFGDHSSKTAAVPVVSHAYSHTGTFRVELVAIDSRGSHSKTTTHKLTVTVPPKPRISKLHVKTCRRRSKRCRRSGLYVRFTLSMRDRVVITITPRHHRRIVKHDAISGRSETSTYRIRFARMRSGSYVLHARAVGGGTASARFSWRSPVATIL
jgi:PKD repeat protein